MDKTQVLHFNFTCVQQDILQQSSVSEDRKESVREGVERTHRVAVEGKVISQKQQKSKYGFSMLKYCIRMFYCSDIVRIQISKCKAQRKTETRSISIKVCKKHGDNLKAICQCNSKAGTVADFSEDADSCVGNKWEALKKNCWQLC